MELPCQLDSKLYLCLFSLDKKGEEVTWVMLHLWGRDKWEGIKSGAWKKGRVYIGTLTNWKLFIPIAQIALDIQLKRKKRKKKKLLWTLKF